ncbi:hypothetical protein D3Z50_21765 [Clostridiaceae bacterium]|nr:hypothetical protein [Clostridiaceae bacterium]
MSHREFCKMIVPMIRELQEECQKMTSEEFMEFRQELMGARLWSEKKLVRKFMTEVLDLLQRNIFQKTDINRASR